MGSWRKHKATFINRKKTSAREEVKIDDVPALSKRYRLDRPVIFIDGVNAFKHRVEPNEFRLKFRRLAKS